MKLLSAPPQPLLLSAPRSRLTRRQRTARARHIVSVGGGLASSLILPLWIKQHYPHDEIVLIMAKLPNEDPDVWRLCDAVESEIGSPVEYIGTHRNPFDAFYQQRFLGNSLVDPCSKYLKREEIAKWLKANYHPSDTLYVGVGAYEAHRWERIYQRWHDSGVRVKMPLMDLPQWTRDSMIEFCQGHYGFVPRLYRWGFDHNNCGGACVKAGHKQWARLLYYLPDVYAWWETEEHKFRKWIKRDVAILKEQRLGVRYPLTLRTFRRRLEWEWAGILPGFVGLLKFDELPGIAELEDTPACWVCDAAA